MKRFVTHSEEERAIFIKKGFKEVGKEDNGNYVFWSNIIEDVLSEREMEVYKLSKKSNAIIALELNISVKSVEGYRSKITSKGF